MILPSIASHPWACVPLRFLLFLDTPKNGGAPSMRSRLNIVVIVVLIMQLARSFSLRPQSHYYLCLAPHVPAFSRLPYFRSPRSSSISSSSRATRRLLSSKSSSPQPFSASPAYKAAFGGVPSAISPYNPQSFESSIYSWWESSGYFDPDAKCSLSPSPQSSSHPTPKPYVLPMPPPNVTGRLHLGHAIFVALQDSLARFHRMRGRPTLWLPGTDHAGIATQLQVEKLIEGEGLSREKLGREAFLQRVWAYKDARAGEITSQLRALGASADWGRERFTMDPHMSGAVTEAFRRLHDKGLVYRGEYMVNWSTRLKTAVSDLEVDHVEEAGKMYYFKYVLEGEDPSNPSSDHLAVATTRPETIFADAAVCVNPSDERFARYVGKRVLLPVGTPGGSGRTRAIPVIADTHVDPAFGTGVLKVTPAHDPADFAIGKRHGLPAQSTLNEDGTLNELAGGKYLNVDRFKAREMVWEEARSSGLGIKVETITTRVPRSQRGGEVIEPRLSSQWFVKTESMGRKALDAVKNGEIKIVPQRFEKTWDQWLDGIHDWCISRQLWWGHRIPVYYLGEGPDSPYVVASSPEEARSIAKERFGYSGDKPLRQDDDVLDTWFSSGIWPFATVGWPGAEGEKWASDYSRFYPASCLETGYDILFFWVARMAMMGIELTGKAPFDTIYLHGLVRASDGSKMSKTKGNVVDPLTTVAKFGADALRFSLITGSTPGQDISLSIEKVEQSRNFVNKLWNCCKFVVENALKADGKEVGDTRRYYYCSEAEMSREEFDNLPLSERWIVSRCHSVIEEITADMEEYRISEAARKVHDFIWDDFCDWYLEISKTRLYEGHGGTDPVARAHARRTLLYVLSLSLRTLHPFAPFATERLWQHLPRADGDDATLRPLMLADWPRRSTSSPLVVDDKVEEAFKTLRTAVRAVRNTRAEHNVEIGRKLPATIFAKGEKLKVVMEEKGALALLGKLGQIAFFDSDSEQGKETRKGMTQGYANIVVDDGIEILLPFKEMMDVVKERERLSKQEEKLVKDVEKLVARLEGKGFKDRAPKEILQKNEEELKNLKALLTKVRENLKSL